MLIKKIWIHCDADTQEITRDVLTDEDEVIAEFLKGVSFRIRDLPRVKMLGVCPVLWEYKVDMSIEFEEPIPASTLRKRIFKTNSVS